MKVMNDCLSHNVSLPHPDDRTGVNWYGGMLTLEAVTKRIQRRLEGTVKIEGHGEDMAWLKRSKRRTELLERAEIWTQNHCKPHIYEEYHAHYRDWKLNKIFGIATQSRKCANPASNAVAEQFKELECHVLRINCTESQFKAVLEMSRILATTVEDKMHNIIRKRKNIKGEAKKGTEKETEDEAEKNVDESETEETEDESEASEDVPECFKKKRKNNTGGCIVVNNKEVGEAAGEALVDTKDVPGRSVFKDNIAEIVDNEEVHVDENTGEASIVADGRVDENTGEASIVEDGRVDENTKEAAIVEDDRHKKRGSEGQQAGEASILISEEDVSGFPADKERKNNTEQAGKASILISEKDIPGCPADKEHKNNIEQAREAFILISEKDVPGCPVDEDGDSSMTGMD